MTLFYDEYIYFAITIFLRARIKVFVPLSGVTSVNNWMYMKIFSTNCFRPLIGVSFCKRCNYKNFPRIMVDEFPSPLSGLASVNTVRLVMIKRQQISFRPLFRGNFCKQVGNYEHRPCNRYVSVPLSGLASVNWMLQKTWKSMSFSFRPLIGVSFCKQQIQNIYQIIFYQMFSSPYRGQFL